ncbi:MAG: hypothetical protein A3J48_01155 [Candidatus Doudnabacteria bacterium RIFCSPHIGHO2_02_FULL_46_11]|uniref:Uncharacterized protein n=1 Tax=Candidatus Doudnabacteria bacterium RIFCSPHIGHO2_02_FULL_46_11 TaxID=1817832 RepID=A0A1F5P7U0_9BACT|nr:MAG: hypothetical protein A3J48_01155 [Candidatus Doudnabacteria bacterium RIFCSPHIGHO2_02_FULL_46_11]
MVLVGGGGRFEIGFCSNVVGAIVISSSIAVALITGVAGRAICCGGGGILISFGISIPVISSLEIEMSADVIVGKKAKSRKWSTAAAVTEPQNQLPKPRLKRSLAVSKPRERVIVASISVGCARII